MPITLIELCRHSFYRLAIQTYTSLNISLCLDDIVWSIRCFFSCCLMLTFGTYSCMLLITMRYPSCSSSLTDYFLLVFKWAKWKLITQRKGVFRLAFIPKDIQKSFHLLVFSKTGSVFSRQLLTLHQNWIWSKVKLIPLLRDFCSGSKCARQKFLPHSSRPSPWSCEPPRGADFQSFQLGMAQAFSYMSHHPVGTSPCSINYTPSKCFCLDMAIKKSII